MKFNLKTMPNCETCEFLARDSDGSPCGCEAEDFYIASICPRVEEWLLCFKKELRQKMENYVKEKPSFSSPQHGAIVTILEILGE